jgi:hypothetical protein
MKAYKGRGSIAPHIPDLDTGMRRVVSLKPWVRYPQGSAGTNCIAGWLGLTTNLDHKIPLLWQDSNPEPYKSIPVPIQIINFIWKI